MKPVLFTYNAHAIAQMVKQESSLVAVTRKSEAGETLYSTLVFDEAYKALFTRLFEEATADISHALNMWTREVQPQLAYRDGDDHNPRERYTIGVLLPNDFNANLVRPIDVKIEEYLVTYILYRWFETKLPDVLQAYIARMNALIADIKQMLSTRSTPPHRRPHSWF